MGENVRHLFQTGKLTDLDHFAAVNEVTAEYCDEPYPARAAIGVAALPKGAVVEMDAVMELAD